MRIGKKFVYCPKCGSGNVEVLPEAYNSLICVDCECEMYREYFDEDEFERVGPD